MNRLCPSTLAVSVLALQAPVGLLRVLAEWKMKNLKGTPAKGPGAPYTSFARLLVRRKAAGLDADDGELACVDQHQKTCSACLSQWDRMQESLLEGVSARIKLQEKRRIFDRLLEASWIFCHGWGSGLPCLYERLPRTPLFAQQSQTFLCKSWA